MGEKATVSGQTIEDGRVGEEVQCALPEEPMVVTYRYADTVEHAVRDFCARALPGERLPQRVEYEVHNTPACDAFIDEIDCLIELSDGDVGLGFVVVQSAWRYPGQDPKDRDPVAEAFRAIRTVYDQDADGEIEFLWDDEAGEWKAKSSEEL